VIWGGRESTTPARTWYASCDEDDGDVVTGGWDEEVSGASARAAADDAYRRRSMPSRHDQQI
jgi:hypothetical protein